MARWYSELRLREPEATDESPSGSRCVQSIDSIRFFLRSSPSRQPEQAIPTTVRSFADNFLAGSLCYFDTVTLPASVWIETD